MPKIEAEFKYFEDLKARRTCDNGRCAEPATWKASFYVGADQGYEERTGPQMCHTYCCDKHRDALLPLFGK